MEAILVMPSPDRGRDFVLPLSMGGIRVRTVVQSGTQLVAEAGREPAECIILPESLPDGPAEAWLVKAAAVSPRRPVAVILVFGVEASEAVRERARAAFGPAVEVVAAGARRTDEVAAEVTRVLDRLSRTLADQDRDAFDRLRQPVVSSTVPQPVRKGGAIALLGLSGGVGTSTLTANLATYAAMAGQRVLVIDAQFATAGSVLYYLGGEPDDHNRGLHHLRWSHMSATNGQLKESAADEILLRTDEVRIKGARHAELRVLSTPAILEQMVQMPADQVVWGMQLLEHSFDLVLVDCGSGVGDSRTLRLLEASGRVLLVAGGWGAGVNAAARCLSALEETESRIGKDRLLLLLREGGEGVYGTRTVSSAVGMPIYGRLPEEPAVRKAEGRLGIRVPVVAEHPDSAYAKSTAQLAFTLGVVQQVETAERETRRGLFGLSFGRR
ncbi:MAG: AAA family ATPase [Bacillota bacterium]